MYIRVPFAQNNISGVSEGGNQSQWTVAIKSIVMYNPIYLTLYGDEIIGTDMTEGCNFAFLKTISCFLSEWVNNISIIIGKIYLEL